MKKAVILVGSPRKKGTSYSFARTIKQLLEARGCFTELIFIIDYLNSNREMIDLKQAISGVDIIGLVTPLYVDTLPYPVIRFMENAAADLKPVLKDRSFFTVSQCGFPDVRLFTPLLNSSRFFAEAVGMKWLGGLGYGGGAIIDGALLENLGKKGKRITRAFGLAMDDILHDRIIASRVQDILEEKIPKQLFIPLCWFLNYRSRQTARRNGVTDLSRKVYLY